MYDREKDTATRAREMPPFIVMDVLEKAQEMEARGENIIHLEIGEPDFATPEPVKEAAGRALAAGDTHYTHSPGKLELREDFRESPGSRNSGHRLRPQLRRVPAPLLRQPPGEHQRRPGPAGRVFGGERRAKARQHPGCLASL